MPKAHAPRSGSMQFWPRKKAKRPYARVRSWPQDKEPKPLGFAGYKAGMTHLIITDNRKTSLTKNENIICPATVIECPPIKISSARFYKKTPNKLILKNEILAEKLDKELGRKISLPKKIKKNFDDIKEFDDIRISVYTQPKLTNIGKKKPELFEIGLGGSKEEKMNFVKENLGKEIDISTIFQEGEQIDVHSVTKGKGYQGPVKRFGIRIKEHKAEKTKRGPGSLGGWKGQGHFMYRIAHAGKMGNHTRTEFNKWIIKIGSNPEEVNPKGGFINYGIVKNKYLLVKGAIIGNKNKIVRFNKSIRPNHKIPAQAPEITYTSLESKQG